MSNTTPPAISQKPTRLGVVLGMLTMLRLETAPPLTRYALLLTLADSKDADGAYVPLTSTELAERMYDEVPQNSSLARMVDAGLVTRKPHGHRSFKYKLSTEGEKEVVRILSGKIKPKSPPPPKQPDMARVNSAAARA